MSLHLFFMVNHTFLWMQWRQSYCQVLQKQWWLKCKTLRRQEAGMIGNKRRAVISSWNPNAKKRKIPKINCSNTKSKEQSGNGVSDRKRKARNKKQEHTRGDKCWLTNRWAQKEGWKSHKGRKWKATHDTRGQNSTVPAESIIIVRLYLVNVNFILSLTSKLFAS